MSDYTHQNLKDDVEDMAVGYGLGDQMETHFARKPLGLQGGGFSYQRYEPNVTSPAHRHKTQEEAYVVVAGSGRIKLGDEVRELRQWDVVRVQPWLARGFSSGPDGLELIAIGFGEGGEAELVDGFWD